MADEVFFNIKAGLQADDVDKLNDKFYSRFNYPWVPMMLPKPQDPQFFSRALNMDLGRYGAACAESSILPGMKIWVAGCGTNQAVLTALKFPQAQVLGSDVSTESLKVCGRVAAQLGLNNLRLQQESLNATAYEAEFDYVICTGVIHHNADPALPLKSLARSLKPDGVLELMVYNYYHRIQTTAFQKAIRLLGGGQGLPDVERELPLTRRLIDSFPGGTHMGEFLALQKPLPEAAVADSLLQPVEFSYTVASLADMARTCGLNIATYCVNQFDKVKGHLDWESEFTDPEVAAAYARLPDLERWQVSNLLRGETSPMLWFYLQRQDTPRPVPHAAALTQAFLDTVFQAARSGMQNYILCGPEEYRLSPAKIPLPAPVKPADPLCAQVLAACDGVTAMRRILQDLGVLNKAEYLRLRLASSGFPYLQAV